MSEDKKTIGLTASNREVIQTLLETELFEDQMDIAKFAMAIAINLGMEPQSVEGVDTTWNIGSFDPDGEIRNLIQVFYPQVDAPYRAVESLLNSGLSVLGKKISDGKKFDLLEYTGA